MKRADLIFAAALIPLDFLVLISAAAVAYSIRFSPIFAKLRPVTFDLPFNPYMNVVIPMALVWIGIFAISGLYSIRPKRIAVEVSRVILAIAAGIGVTLAIAFFSRELFDSRFIVLAIWVLTMLFIIIERILIRILQRRLRKSGIGMQHVLIVGHTKSAHALKSFFRTYPKFGYNVVGHVPEFNEAAREKILNLKQRDRADMLMIANPDMTREELSRIKSFSDIEHLQFIYSADMFPGNSARPIYHTFAGQPVIEVPKTPLYGWGAIYKRVFDITVSSTLILATLPIQIITTIAIKTNSKGPVLFFQKRVGQGGKHFTYFKFRSMVVDAEKLHFDEQFLEEHKDEDRSGPLVKIVNDPRVTRVGKIIRKFSIDEIPEFYNVFLGKMSLVGPRPHMPGEVEQYEPSQRRVLTIKPGITGMAQISGRGTLGLDKEVGLDMHYIENWSPWLDIIILLKTPFAVFEKLD